MPGDIILHMCSINGNHIYMVPEIWSVTERRFPHFETFSSFLTVFCPNNPKNQNFEKMKKKA